MATIKVRDVRTSKNYGTAKDATAAGVPPGAVRWDARLRGSDGKQVQRTFETKGEAEKWVAEQENAKATRTYIAPRHGRQKFEAWADEWAEAQEWKDTTRENWAAVRSRLMPLLGSRPLDSIDKVTMQKVRGELAKRYAHNTVKTTAAYLGMVLRAAYASGRIGRDPTVGMKAPKRRADDPDGKVQPEDVPTRAEALAILTGAPGPYRAAIALGLAGLRVGEVLGMSADRLLAPCDERDCPRFGEEGHTLLDHRRVRVDRQLQRIGGKMTHTTPKAEKMRTITVPGLIAMELRRHLRDYASDGLLFRGLRGSEMLRRDQFYASAWKPALRGAGLAEDRFVFHALRHWCASTLLADGAPLTAVAGHLGDTVETVSRIYVHWLRDDRDVPANVLDRVLAPTSEAQAAQL